MVRLTTATSLKNCQLKLHYKAIFLLPKEKTKTRFQTKVFYQTHGILYKHVTRVQKSYKITKSYNSHDLNHYEILVISEYCN